MVTAESGISIHYAICIMNLTFQKIEEKKERENTKRPTRQVCEPCRGHILDGHFAKSALFGGGGDMEPHTTLSPGARAGFLKKHVMT